MTEGGGAPTEPRAAILATVAVGLLVVLVLLVAVWAAAAGPDETLRGTGTPPERISLAPQTTDAAATDGNQEAPEEQSDTDGTWIGTVIGVLVLTLGVMVGLGALWLLGGALWRLRDVRLHRRRREPELPPLDPVEAVVGIMLADAEAQEDLLTSGTPRNAVVQCWHRFEVQAAAAGVPRQPWETSAEFTLRLLELVEADATSVARLSELYREARFSEHELGEDARAAALDVLRAIHRDLRTLLSGGRL
ncbi:DUF4129 domain-containing protein [Nocardioides rubriscoriae]|uniref:DUF4129 domain-containing protein n=1 Tax=Nocardioides rubriscoriae TaxID=642762 RepID=UPI0011DFA7E6|nr:DUF4129 domain-containing protein [Nocardioides rubriscoriae]